MFESGTVPRFNTPSRTLHEKYWLAILLQYVCATMQERHYAISNQQQLQSNLFYSHLTGPRTRGGTLLEVQKLLKLSVARESLQIVK